MMTTTLFLAGDPRVEGKRIHLRRPRWTTALGDTRLPALLIPNIITEVVDMSLSGGCLFDDMPRPTTATR